MCKENIKILWIGLETMLATKAAAVSWNYRAGVVGTRQSQFPAAAKETEAGQEHYHRRQSGATQCCLSIVIRAGTEDTG